MKERCLKEAYIRFTAKEVVSILRQRKQRMVEKCICNIKTDEK